MVCEQEEQERGGSEESCVELETKPLGWGDVRWESPDQLMHCRFELSLESNRQVRCNYVEQEGPRDMRRRFACDDRFVLPLTTPCLEATVGFVEGYLDPETVDFTEQGAEIKTLRPMVMVSMSLQAQAQGAHVAERLAIWLNDSIVLTGWKGISVDLHCGNDDSDVFSPHISAENWTDQILEWRVNDDSPIPCSCLLVQLSRKLCHLNEFVTVREEQELRLDAMFAVEAEEDQRLVHHQQQEQGKLEA